MRALRAIRKYVVLGLTPSGTYDISHARARGRLRYIRYCSAREGAWILDIYLLHARLIELHSPCLESESLTLSILIFLHVPLITTWNTALREYCLQSHYITVIIGSFNMNYRHSDVRRHSGKAAFKVLLLGYRVPNK